MRTASQPLTARSERFLRSTLVALAMLGVLSHGRAAEPPTAQEARNIVENMWGGVAHEVAIAVGASGRTYIAVRWGSDKSTFRRLYVLREFAGGYIDLLATDVWSTSFSNLMLVDVAGDGTMDVYWEDFNSGIGPGEYRFNLLSLATGTPHVAIIDTWQGEPTTRVEFNDALTRDSRRWDFIESMMARSRWFRQADPTHYDVVAAHEPTTVGDRGLVSPDALARGLALELRQWDIDANPIPCPNPSGLGDIETPNACYAVPLTDPRHREALRRVIELWPSFRWATDWDSSVVRSGRWGGAIMWRREIAASDHLDPFCIRIVYEPLFGRGIAIISDHQECR